MNNPKVILSIGFLLLGIIGYQGYLLYQKDAPTEEIIEKKIVKKDAPEIHINIDKTPSQKEKEISQSTSHLTPQERKDQDEERIEKSILEVFRSILASKEVQEGISEIKEKTTENIQELKEELKELPSKIESMQSEFKDDPFFSQVLGQIKGFGGKQFDDLGDYYHLKIDVPEGEKAKIDIQIKGHFLTVRIDAQKETKDTSIQATVIKQIQNHRSSSIIIPEDALAPKLQTHYENGILEITIPKITTKTSL